MIYAYIGQKAQFRLSWEAFVDFVGEVKFIHERSDLDIYIRWKKKWQNIAQKYLR